MLGLVVVALEEPAARVQEAEEEPAVRVREAGEEPAARVREAGGEPAARVREAAAAQEGAGLELAAAVVLEAEHLPVQVVVALELAAEEALAEGLLPRVAWRPREPQVVAMEQAVVPEPQVAAGQAEPQQLEPVAELAGRVQALVLRLWGSCRPLSSP